jgi:hypothetical protein
MLFFHIPIDIKSKAVPLHAMEALVGRGDIAPTHSRPRHYMGWVVSVTPRPRFTSGGRTPVPIVQAAGWGPRAGLDTEVRGQILCLCRGSNLNRPVVQPEVRHYTAWATPAPLPIDAISSVLYLRLKVCVNFSFLPRVLYALTTSSS